MAQERWWLVSKRPYPYPIDYLHPPHTHPTHFDENAAFWLIFPVCRTSTCIFSLKNKLAYGTFLSDKSGVQTNRRSNKVGF
jgi:hypothetical protein